MIGSCRLTLRAEVQVIQPVFVPLCQQATNKNNSPPKGIHLNKPESFIIENIFNFYFLLYIECILYLTVTFAPVFFSSLSRWLHGLSFLSVKLEV